MMKVKQGYFGMRAREFSLGTKLFYLSGPERQFGLSWPRRLHLFFFYLIKYPHYIQNIEPF
jgi:hypothetical protein